MLRSILLMRKYLYLKIIVLIISIPASAQKYIEPIVGYQVSPKENYIFSQLNAGVQWVLLTKKRKPFFLKIMASLPIANRSLDTAYTTNITFPVLSQVKKVIKPLGFEMSIGKRFIIPPTGKYNKCSFILLAGIAYQRLQVENNFDKKNYELLNPDRTISRFGGLVCFQFEYMRILKNGRLFIQTGISSSPISKRKSNQNSFKFLVPIAFNLGYSIKI